MRAQANWKSLALHAGLIAVLALLFFVLPDYHRGNLSRVMVLAAFAMGYNLLFGYCGLLSLGHAMFFAAGVYGAGLVLYHLEWNVVAALASGIVSGAMLAVIVGALALRTTGVAFMIVTLMFAEVFHLASLYFTTWTRGEEGLVLASEARLLDLGAVVVDPTDPVARYWLAFSLFAIVLFLTLAVVRAPLGRVLVAIRENEDRVRMLGYDVFRAKLMAVVLSGTICATAGAFYALLFGYLGSGFAAIQYSILALLWVLVGGAATIVGPFVGTLLMFYLIDFSNDFLNAWLPGWNLSHLGIVGVGLILLVLFFPKGIMGTLRERWLTWLP